MPDALVKVKVLAQDMRRWSQDLKDDKPELSKRHAERAESIEAVAHELEAARKRLLSVPTEYGDLSDLPPSVLAQLNLTKIDELEQQMRDIVAAADGQEVGLDTIIIELWRRHKVEQERRFIMNKLYRMAQKGLISSVDGKKGVYYLPKPRGAGDWGKGASTKGGFGDDLDDDIPF